MTPTASCVMSRRIAVVSPDVSCTHAWAALRLLGAPCVVVASLGDEGVLGVVTERELIAVSTEYGGRRRFPIALSVGDVMTPGPWCVAPSATLGELCEDFLQRHLDAAPVVADDGELVGVVTTTDVLRALQCWALVEPRRRAA